MNPDTELRDVLHRRAADTPIVSTPLDVVAGRARVVRRRRRAVVAAGAAVAVAAVVVPLSLLGDDEPGAQPPVATAPDASVDVTGAPRIGYAAGPQYYFADGTTTPLPDADSVWAWAPPDAQGVYNATPIRSREVSLVQVRFSENGVVGDGWCSWTPPAVAVDGTFAFTMIPCDMPLEGSGPVGLTVQPPEGEARIQQVSEFIQPVGLLGTGEVVFADTGDGGVWVTDLESPPRRIPDLPEATSTASGEDAPAFVAGRFIDGDWGVLTPDGAVQWRRGDLVETLTFNASGTRLLARLDDGRLVLLDAATGETRTHVEASGPEDFPTLIDVAWEDDRYLLGSRLYNKGAVLVRIDSTDGSITEIGDPPAGSTHVIWSPVPLG